MRILVVKTSSLGDVIHTLPALTDAMRAMPYAMFDWAVEEAFQEVPGWHPAVREVIPVALRRWRKSIKDSLFGHEWRECKHRLRDNHYDCVIDAQGLLKSVWVARQARAPIYGLDKNSAREPAAAWFYRYTFNVPWDLHAVERVRNLFSQALGYSMPSARGDYGLDKNFFVDIVPRERRVLFLHGTTRADKHWPETYWQQLCAHVNAADCRVLLPWGNDIERERAQRIAASARNAQVLPRMSLSQLAAEIATCVAVVTVDSGLGHLTAALDVPAIALYGPTDPAKIGTYGLHQTHLSANAFADVN
ncbi:MAG TPA: lipopolysaccharide heptosyltransferase I, partial [Spongiibacteraceae bacterium]|nr:lipopolysaccharide heptosyltransferase I [Spongiibacteraceae bacterium]